MDLILQVGRDPGPTEVREETPIEFNGARISPRELWWEKDDRIGPRELSRLGSLAVKPVEVS